MIEIRELGADYFERLLVRLKRELSRVTVGGVRWEATVDHIARVEARLEIERQREARARKQ